MPIGNIFAGAAHLTDTGAADCCVGAGFILLLMELPDYLMLDLMYFFGDLRSMPSCHEVKQGNPLQ